MDTAEGYHTGIADDPYRFDDMDRHQTQVGARLEYVKEKTFMPYIGVK